MRNRFLRIWIIIGVFLKLLKYKGVVWEKYLFGNCHFGEGSLRHILEVRFRNLARGDSFGSTLLPLRFQSLICFFVARSSRRRRYFRSHILVQWKATVLFAVTTFEGMQSSISSFFSLCLILYLARVGWWFYVLIFCVS